MGVVISKGRCPSSKGVTSADVIVVVVVAISEEEVVRESRSCCCCCGCLLLCMIDVVVDVEIVDVQRRLCGTSSAMTLFRVVVDVVVHSKNAVMAIRFMLCCGLRFWFELVLLLLLLEKRGVMREARQHTLGHCKTSS